MFLLGIPWLLVVKLVLAIPTAIFNFLLDPEPSGGRTNEEAKLVVQNGQKAIALLELNRPATEWSDEAIEAVSQLTLTSRLYQRKIQDRLYSLRDHYVSNPQLCQSEYNSKRFLSENNLQIGWIEAVVTNPMYRCWVLQHLFLLAIFFINVR
jgi:hypothetical protein